MKARPPWLPVAVSALAFAGASDAQARGPLSLRWSAPAGCPTGEAVLASVERLRPHAFQRPPTRPLAAEVIVTPEGARWSLTLALHAAEETGARSLTADTCAEAADAAAVVLALAIDPTARRPPPAPEPPPAAPPPTRDDRPRVGGGVHGALDLGSLPAPAWGVGAGVGFARSWLRLELGATWFPAQRAVGAAGTASDVGLVTGELRACAMLLRGAAVGAGLCAGVAGGAMYARGVGFDRNEADVTPWWTALAGATLRVSLRREVAAWARLDLGASLGDARFLAADGAELHHPARLVGRGGVGVELSGP